MAELTNFPNSRHGTGHPRKPSNPIASTDEGISIRESDVHPQNPEISLKRLSDEKTIVFSDVHPKKPSDSIISTDEGISIS
jgi:hypothetical protein